MAMVVKSDIDSNGGTMQEATSFPKYARGIIHFFPTEQTEDGLESHLQVS